MAEEYDNTDDEIEDELEQIEREKEDEESKPSRQSPMSAVRGRGRPPLAKSEPVRSAAPLQETRQPRQQVSSQATKERYLAIHQLERIAVLDTVQEKVISEGYKDIGNAMADAEILNNQEKIMAAVGI